MPRVLRLLNRLNLGGPTHNAAYLSKYLAPEFETLLVAGMIDESEDSSEFIVEQMGLKPVRVPDMRREIDFVSDLCSYQGIKALIRDFKPDIVHTHAAKAGALGRLAARACGVPVVIHTYHGHVFHSYFPPLKTKVFTGIERYLAGKTDAIIAVSERQKEEIGATYGICPPEKITVVPLGFDLSRFREDPTEKRRRFRFQYGLKEEDIAIGIIGRLVPIKNHALFLEAVKKVKETSPKNVRAFIIGDGEVRADMEKIASRLGVDVTFTSWIREVDRVYAGLDIVALTSLNEGTPVSLIEAQASGKPIVSTRVGGVEDVVCEGRTALLSASGNVRTFAENLGTLIEDGALRFEMGSQGPQQVMERYHYVRLVEDVRELYRRLLKP